MSDIELACHIAPWGLRGMIHALSDIERAGFRGIEMTAEIVEEFEDRVIVFQEILSQHKLRLMAITAGGSMWPGMNLDEEVEKSLNIARFLHSAGTGLLTLLPPMPNPEQPIEDELDLMPAATAYGEIARRTLEFDVTTCLHPLAGSHVETLPLLDRFIEMADPEALKLCVDSGFLAEAKLPPERFLKEHGKRIGLVHLRDIKARNLKTRKPAKGRSKPRRRSTPPPRPPSIELGKGSVDLHAFVDVLLAIDYSGWATIEFDAPAHKSLSEAAASCFQYAEQSLDLVL